MASGSRPVLFTYETSLSAGGFDLSFSHHDLQLMIYNPDAPVAARRLQSSAGGIQRSLKRDVGIGVEGNRVTLRNAMQIISIR